MAIVFTIHVPTSLLLQINFYQCSGQSAVLIGRSALIGRFIFFCKHQSGSPEKKRQVGLIIANTLMID